MTTLASFSLRIIYSTSGFWPRVRARALRAPVFFNSLPSQTRRCAPIAASLLLIRPLKIFTIYRSWAAHVKGFFLSTVPQRLWGPLPPVPPLPAIFWGQKYILVRPYAIMFSVFLFFSCWILSFRYSLFFLISFSISSYSSLLVSFYSSRRAIIRLLILLLLYFQLFVV